MQWRFCLCSSMMSLSSSAAPTRGTTWSISGATLISTSLPPCELACTSCSTLHLNSPFGVGVCPHASLAATAHVDGGAHAGVH